ncbi:hypothetical protein AB1Y20_015441 [Prymnesium parvum]|uniref:MYND-type domain-containing protein n=1 Tax=Prymnesium parvum TaxID=97485 RepID=A0AB34JYH7_PRYPA
MTRCWGCGAAEGAVRFPLCTLCREEGLVSHFCGTHCLESAWPRHKEWHREQRRLHSLAEAVALQHWRRGASATSPYDELLSAASALQLGTVSSSPAVAAHSPAVSDALGAAQQYIHAVERSTASTLGWAEQVVSAFALLSQESIASAVQRPGWWNDDALKALSEQVLTSRPDYSLAWRMRGEVLCACLGNSNWEAAPRSAAELHEAGRCFQRAAALGVDEAGVDREAVVRQAVACLREAQAQASLKR